MPFNTSQESAPTQDCLSPACPQMSRVQVARLMLRQGITGNDATIMTAIAEAESALRACAGGDCPNALIRAGSTATNVQRAREWSCPPNNDQAPSSWGLWQIFVGFHHSDLANYFGVAEDPCVLADVLQDPENNAAFAARLFRSPTGFNHWTTYNTGSYRAFLPQAEIAVAQAIALEPTIPLPGTDIVASPSQVFAGLAIISGAILVFLSLQ